MQNNTAAAMALRAELITRGYAGVTIYHPANPGTCLGAAPHTCPAADLGGKPSYGGRVYRECRTAAGTSSAARCCRTI